MICLRINEILKQKKKTKYWFVKNMGQRISVTLKTDK